MEKLYTYNQLSSDKQVTAYNSYLELVYDRQSDEYLTIDKFCNNFGIEYEVDDEDEPYAQPSYATSNYDDITYTGEKLAKYVVKALKDMEAYPQPIDKNLFERELLQPLYDFVEQPTDDTTFSELLMECLTSALEYAKDEFMDICCNNKFPYKCTTAKLKFYESGEICA